VKNRGKKLGLLKMKKFEVNVWRVTTKSKLKRGEGVRRKGKRRTKKEQNEGGKTPGMRR